VTLTLRSLDVLFEMPNMEVLLVTSIHRQTTPASGCGPKKYAGPTSLIKQPMNQRKKNEKELNKLSRV
jgi:hypothetical protein